MDEDRKLAVRVIRKYIAELESSATLCWTSESFMQNSFSRIAAIKLLNRLKSYEKLSATTIIENFRDEMNRYSYMNEFMCREYSIQFDASTYILDEIIAIKERRMNQNEHIKTKQNFPRCAKRTI